MLSFDLKSLRLFVAVCDAQSISQAAEQEHLEPSAVSKRISQLEEMAGLPLVVRHRSGIRPTDAGKLLLEQARAVLMGMDRIEHDLLAFKSNDHIRLRLLAPTSAMVKGLFRHIETFLREPANAAVRISVEEMPTSLILREVRADARAIGICWDAGTTAGIETRPYRSETLVLITPPGHPLASRTKLSFSETLAYPYVGLPPGTTVHSLLHAAATKAKASLTYRLNVSNFDVVCHAVAAGMAIGVVPSLVLSHHLSSKDLVGITLEDEWTRRSFVACFKGFAGLPREGQALVEHLTRER